MTRLNKLPVLIFFILAGGCLRPAIACAQDLYDASHTRKYADHFFFLKRYPDAVKEYERALHFYSGNDSILGNYFISARNSGLYNQGAGFLERSYMKGSTIPKQVPVYLEKLYLLGGRFSEADSLLKLPLPVLEKDSAAYRCYTRILDGKWPGKGDSLSGGFLAYSNNAGAWQKLVSKEQNLKYKLPGIALCLSAVVPGAGKVYSGAWKDGAVSFLMVGSMAYESYVGFRTRGARSVLGWVFGGLAVGFYGGNLYGSWHSALRYNEQEQNKLNDEAYRLAVSDF